MKPDDIKESDAMELLIISPDETVFNGKVKAISLNNDLGPFDVIPYHETFISIVQQQLVIYPVGGQKREIKVDKGIIRIHKNQVQIFLGLNTEMTLDRS